MAEVQKKKLFFISSPAHNLKAIEAFLTKRNFDVIFENNFESSLVKIEALAPDFIFIAWDHPDSQLTSLPKAIEAISSVPIVPYVQSTSKEAIRRLEFSGFNQKLYPPLSGPAIERLVLKALKALEIDPHAFTQGGLKSSSNRNKIQKVSNRQFSNGNGFAIQKGNRGEFLQSKNKSLEQMIEKSISRLTKEQLKSNFDESIKQSFEDLIETYNDSTTANENDSGEAILQSFDENASQNNLQSDVLSAELEQAKLNFSRQQGKNLIKRTIYCMTIQSNTWCGYLVVYSDFNIDFSLSQHLFRQWLSSNFENLQEFEDSEQFEINISNADYHNLAEGSADYFEKVERHGKEIIISFFTVDPKLLLIDLNERDLIGVPLDIIPTGRQLSLSFFLHLPKNKKFLLYTPVNQTLDTEQHRRLTEKRVEKLFTPIEFEKEYRILRAENYLNSIPYKLKAGT